MMSSSTIRILLLSVLLSLAVIAYANERHVKHHRHADYLPRRRYWSKEKIAEKKCALESLTGACRANAESTLAFFTKGKGCKSGACKYMPQSCVDNCLCSVAHEAAIKKCGGKARDIEEMYGTEGCEKHCERRARHQH